MTFYTATTRRTSESPRLHALRLTAHRRGRTTRRAACGAGVRPAWGAPFNPGHPRACPRCVTALRRGEAL